MFEITLKNLSDQRKLSSAAGVFCWKPVRVISKLRGKLLNTQFTSIHFYNLFSTHERYQYYGSCPSPAEAVEKLAEASAGNQRSIKKIGWRSEPHAWVAPASDNILSASNSLVSYQWLMVPPSWCCTLLTLIFQYGASTLINTLHFTITRCRPSLCRLLSLFPYRPVCV